MSKQNHLYVDIHVLQTVPPSCVNRDDTGSPKTAVYGGVRRARVSSQSWKRAVRLSFREMYEPEELALRTKRIVRMVQDRIAALSPEADAEKMAVEVLKSAGLPINEKDLDKGTEALFFMSVGQADALAKLAVDDSIKGKDREAACREALKDHASIDLALFGRMVASDPSLNYDAAAQVAHAISTHGVQNEFDYFTAVDDLAPEDSAGAGHLGTVEFNSSTLYRYATVNVEELRGNLGIETPAAVKNFIQAFVLSMPTGKQNTFANRTLPDAVYVTVRKDQPVNLVGAFEEPVQAENAGGYSKASCKRLADYSRTLYENYTGKPAASWTLGCSMEGAEMLPLPQLLEAVEGFLASEAIKG